MEKITITEDQARFLVAALDALARDHDGTHISAAAEALIKYLEQALGEPAE